MNQKKKETVVALLALVALVLVTVGISYAAFIYIGQGRRENTIQTGNLTFVYDESNAEGNGISIENATPKSDDEGSSAIGNGDVFEFSVTASTKGAPIYYEIYVTKQDSSTLPEKVVKTYLTSVQGEEEIGLPNTLTNEAINTYNKLGISQVPAQENGRTLYQEMIPAGLASYAKTFRYRMWIADSATEVNKNGEWIYNNMSFTVKVNVYASNEEIGLPIPYEQEPNKPVLVQGQIPVVYDSTRSSWVKADTSSEWYNYKEQNWANAVTVTETNRETIMNASAGTPISMDDINTMWVWIPRYEYMYTNLSDYNQNAGGTKELPGEIKINFLSGTETIASDSANYKVHPAFTFGEDELEGLWYGKFETSTTDSACNTRISNCNKLMTSLQIKPNVGSWRFATPSNFFNSSRNMQLQYANTYGFSKTDSDIHMSKNSEWGAVAYLSQSKYGKYGNPNYEGANKEVYQNKSSSYITGMSNGTPSTSTTNTQNSYEVEEIGTGASTTGNITGVYDMSGGAIEYVMGYFTRASSIWGAASSLVTSSVNNYAGFTSKPEDKYFDDYATTSAKTSCSGGACFGHALSETSEWYDDYASFVSYEYPWFIRGGYWNNNTGAGVFYSSAGNGNADTTFSSRLTHVPLK